MANEAELAIVLRARDEASKVLKTMDEQVKKSSDFIKEHAKAIGLAFAAAGAAGLKLVDDAKELNAQLGITAKDLGLTTGEMRDLVLETANVTLPVEEAIKSFDLLTRAGIKDAQTVADVTNAFDSLADATGKNTSAVVEELIPAFKAFKIPLEDAGKHVDKFMWLTRNTTVDVGDFARAVEYIAPDMDTLGLSIEDTVAMMAAMEAKGVSGTMVTRELRTAVSQAAKGEVDLMTALGLTKEELDKYSTSIADSTGMTQEYADIANSQFGIVDKLKHGFKELTLQLGSYLEPMEPILAGMTAMGPIMMALSTSAAQKAIKFGLATASMIAHTTATIASTIATKAATAATWLFTTAMTANPIWLVVAALGALATALGVTWLWTNKMTDSTENMTKAMSDLEKQMFLTRMQQQFSSDEWAEVEKRGYLTEKQFSNLAKQLEITTQELYDQMQAAGALEVVMATVGDTNVYLKVKVNQTSIATQELTTAIKEQAEALDAQDSALEQANRRFNELLQTLQYNESQAKAFGLTMDDLYNYMWQASYALEDVRKIFDMYGNDVNATQEALDKLGLEAETVARQTGKLADVIGDDMVNALNDMTKATEKARQEQDRLDDTFGNLMKQLEYENSAAGELGITMHDLYDLMYDLGWETDQIREAFEKYESGTWDVQDALEAMGYTAKEVRKILDDQKDAIDKVTKSQKASTEAFTEYMMAARGITGKTGEAASMAFEELAIAQQSAPWQGSQEWRNMEAEREQIFAAGGQWGIGNLVNWFKRWAESTGYGLPAYQRGTWGVPQTGPAVVHKGETIIPSGGLTIQLVMDGEIVAEKVISRASDLVRLQGAAF